MTSYTATIEWERADAAFTDRRYSRAHRWTFDGGIEVPASSSPGVVPVPWSRSDAVDPEEAFIAALASCHMLWFLAIAAERHFVVERYRDVAAGEMGTTATGRTAITHVTLRPVVRFAGERRPGPADHAAMHDLAHQECYIANSVRTEILCEPVIEQ